MRLWTVQPLLVWERVQSQGVLHVDPEYTGYGTPDSYLWLVEQLKKYQRGYSGRLPWWAYCQKPDLRWVRHHCPLGQIHVRLELELPRKKAFIFSRWAWDVVYCGDFLAYGALEYAKWHGSWQAMLPYADVRAWELPEPWYSQLRASWERLFDPDLPSKSWEDFSEGPDDRFEAVFEPLRLQDVKQVTSFIGARKRARA